MDKRDTNQVSSPGKQGVNGAPTMEERMRGYAAMDEEAKNSNV